MPFKHSDTRSALRNVRIPLFLLLLAAADCPLDRCGGLNCQTGTSTQTAGDLGAGNTRGYGQPDCSTCDHGGASVTWQPASASGQVILEFSAVCGDTRGVVYTSTGILQDGIIAVSNIQAPDACGDTVTWNATLKNFAAQTMVNPIVVFTCPTSTSSAATKPSRVGVR